MKAAVTSRDEAIKVACPKCGAGVHLFCTEENGRTRKAIHKERHARAITELGSPVRFIGGVRVHYDSEVGEAA